LAPAGTERDEATASSVGPGHSVRRKLVGLALSMLLSSLGISIANVALPALAVAFAAPFHWIQWVVTSYLLAITTTIVGAGRLGDIVGRQRVLAAGISLFTAASVLCGVAPALWVLVAARGVQGLAAAALMSLSVALIRETVPEERTGGAMGLLGTMSALGMALGTALGGILIAGAGWRAIFLILVPLGIVNFLLARGHPPAPRRAGQQAGTVRSDLDGSGTLLLGLTLAAFVLAVTAGGSDFGPLNVSLLLAAALCGGLFLLAETRAAAPLIRLASFRDPVLSSGLVVNALASTVMMATLVVGPFYLSQALGLGAALVGVVLSVGPVVSALTGVPAGRLVDRFGARSAITAGLVQMAAGAFGLCLLPPTFGIVGYIAALLVLTPGYQLFLAANNTAVMMGADPGRQGVVSGMLGLSRNLGLITGASAMGAVFASAAGTSNLAAAAPDAVASGMRITFAVAGTLIVVSVLIVIGSRALSEDDTGIELRFPGRRR